MTFPAPCDLLTLAARASRQEKLLALTCDQMIKDLKAQFLKAILKSPKGMGDSEGLENSAGNVALPSPEHRAGKPTHAGSEAMVMGCRKQSSASHHGFGQPQSPQHIPTCCLHGLFLMEKGLTRVLHHRTHRRGFPSPNPIITSRDETASRAPSLCLVKTLDQRLVPNAKEMS